jgi:hypothetical protein
MFHWSPEHFIGGCEELVAKAGFYGLHTAVCFPRFCMLAVDLVIMATVALAGMSGFIGGWAGMGKASYR